MMENVVEIDELRIDPVQRGVVGEHRPHGSIKVLRDRRAKRRRPRVNDGFQLTGRLRGRRGHCRRSDKSEKPTRWTSSPLTLCRERDDAVYAELSLRFGGCARA